MKFSWLKGIYIIGVLLILAACKGGEIYPIIPSIEYESSYIIKDSAGKTRYVGLILKFRDGDGDVGLAPGDTFPPYNFVKDPSNPDKNSNYFYENLYVDYLEKNGSEYHHVVTPFTTDTLRKTFRVMVLTPEGKYKAIRGNIDVKFEPSIFPNRADTIKLKFKLLDRMLHESNIAESTDIVIGSE
jgi:hypothetical protein